MMSKELPKLKPCPFCHGNAKFIKLPNVHYPFRVSCLKCNATAGGSAFPNYEYNAGVWNTRHGCEYEIVSAIQDDADPDVAHFNQVCNQCGDERTVKSRALKTQDDVRQALEQHQQKLP
jgi:hypothetical protein